MDRICIYPEDVSKLTGRGIRYSQKVLQNLRSILKKEKHQCITKQELALYLGFDPESIQLK